MLDANFELSVSSVLLNPLCKGNAKAAVEAYIKGTSFVKEFNIDQHLLLIDSMYFSVTTNSEITSFQVLEHQNVSLRMTASLTDVTYNKITLFNLILLLLVPC